MATAIMWSPLLIGYLMGSLPSAYIIAHVWAQVDLRREGDGHISATAAYRYLGWKAFAIVMVMDIGKGILSIYVASLFTDSQLILVLTACTTVIGHCWSIYLGFKGGLGGAVSFAVLAALALKEAFIGVGFFLIVLGITRKTSWGTYVLLLGASAALAIERASLVMILFPLGLITIHLIKRCQTRKVNPNPEYSNEALADLKRGNKISKH